MQAYIALDFDGTLADTLQDMLQFAAQICEEMGYPCVPTAEHLNQLERMEFESLGLALGIPPAEASRFAQRSFELFASRPEPPNAVRGMPQVVRRLAASIPIAIITGNATRVVEAFLRRYALSDALRFLQTTDDPGNRVEKLQRITQKLGGGDQCGYLVGDAVSDMRAAKEAGYRSVAVLWGHQEEGRLRAMQPDFVAAEPQDLLRIFGIEYAR